MPPSKPTDTVAKCGPNTYARPTLGKCFHCGQVGHLSNYCPQRRALAIVDEDDQYDPEVDQSGDDDIDYVEPDEGDPLSRVLQRVLLAPKIEHNNQRHSLFCTHCTINGKICNILIDSNSSKNMVSKKLVAALNLKIDPHPNPYKVSWIKKGGEVTIQSACTIPLSIGNQYKDQVVCDVLEMDACHVLLGRPWQFDLQAIHKGCENTYEFNRMGKNIVLLPSNVETKGKRDTQGSSKQLFPLISGKTILKKDDSIVWALVVKGASPLQPTPANHPAVMNLLREFHNITTDPTGLPPLREEIYNTALTSHPEPRYHIFLVTG